MKIARVLLFIFVIASPTLARQRGNPQGPAPSSKTVPSSKSITSANSAVTTPAPATNPVPNAATVVVPSEPGLGSKLIHYSEKDVVGLKTKLQYITMIILPKGEKILDFACGDREFWVVEGSDNFAYVKPAKSSARTNLNLITASGNIYSFSLVEVSGTPESEPDQKVFVDLKDEAMLSAVNGPHRFVSAEEVEKLRQKVNAAEEETKRIRQITDETIEKGIGKILSKVRCNYTFKKNKKPFYVSTICHDDKFTYISMSPEETPTLVDLREGENIVNFSYQPTAPMSIETSRPNSGILTIQKIVQRGYIAIGKQRLNFSIQE